MTQNLKIFVEETILHAPSLSLVSLMIYLSFLTFEVLSSYFFFSFSAGQHLSFFHPSPWLQNTSIKKKVGYHKFRRSIIFTLLNLALKDQVWPYVCNRSSLETWLNNLKCMCFSRFKNIENISIDIFRRSWAKVLVLCFPVTCTNINAVENEKLPFFVIN